MGTAADVVARLSAVVDELSALDTGTLTDAELHRIVVAVQRQRTRLGVAAATLVDAWDRSRHWMLDGSRSAAARLARETATSLASARTELRRGRAVRTMPVAAAAIHRGELSLDHLDLLDRANRPAVADLFARDEQVLVDQCTSLRFAQAVQAVDYWSYLADAEGAEDEARRRRDAAHVHASTTFQKTVVIDAVLDPVRGAIVTGELDRLERELYLTDQRNGVERTASQRRADALVEMATRSATAPANGRRPRPLFSVVVGDASLERLCELANGTVITPGDLVPWLGTAEIESLVFDGKFTVLGVSHRRTFTGALRRAIEVRDRHCQHEAGCDVRADQSDVDHIVPVGRGGVTVQFNGRMECPPHNRHSHLHDGGAAPLQSRPVTWLDLIRARARWRVRHCDGNDDDGHLADTG